MHFVQFTLNPPAAVVAAAYGSFSAPKEQEIVVARQGGALELLRPDEATGRLATVASTATFSCVRALCAVRPTGAATDDVAVASDAGTLTVLRFDAARGAWRRRSCPARQPSAVGALANRPPEWMAGACGNGGK